jgi:soluble lytic murein transglycosylase-like protein
MWVQIPLSAYLLMMFLQYNELRDLIKCSLCEAHFLSAAALLGMLAMGDGYTKHDDNVKTKNVSIVHSKKALNKMIKRIALKYDVDPNLIKAMISVESAYKSDAISSKGAIGYMQLMPGTAEDMGINPYDAEENIEGGTKYISKLLDMFGDYELALAAYNAGPGAVIKYDGIPPYKETVDYVNKVMSKLEHVE